MTAIRLGPGSTIAITGASGLIGSALAASLEADGVHAIRMVRRVSEAPGPPPPDAIAWDPGREWVDIDACGAAEVAGVVHLAGAGVGDRRWTAAYQRTILESRVRGTRAIASAVAELDPRPVLVSGSAIGYYGDTGSRVVDESGICGDTFLADVVRQWEGATTPARRAGARAVCARTGLVVSSRGGAFARLIKLTRMGLGGRIGSGSQLWSFIALADEVAALRWCLEHDVDGPINLVAPQPAPNREIMREMGHILHRPSLVPAPALALRIAVGKFANEILASQGVLPGRLSQGGFTWQAPTFGAALELELESSAKSAC